MPHCQLARLVSGRVVGAPRKHSAIPDTTRAPRTCKVSGTSGACEGQLLARWTVSIRAEAVPASFSITTGTWLAATNDAVWSATCDADNTATNCRRVNPIASAHAGSCEPRFVACSPARSQPTHAGRSWPHSGQHLDHPSRCAN